MNLFFPAILISVPALAQHPSIIVYIGIFDAIILSILEIAAKKSSSIYM